MQILWLDTIDSTNSEALRRLPELPSATVLAAREQTAGRGQRGNTWFTEAGKNLTFSIVLKWDPGAFPVQDAHWLNYLSSYAVLQFLAEHGVSAQVKWPNDIYVGRRKICGMLVENSLNGSSLAASVVGIGLNVNQMVFPQLANATSMAVCTGNTLDLEPALQELVALFERNLSLLFDPKLFQAYSADLFQKGIRARYHDLLTDREYTGVIQGVEADGRLRIRDLDASIDHLYRFKEVGYIL